LDSRPPYGQESRDSIIGKVTRLEVEDRGILVSSYWGYNITGCSLFLKIKTAWA
jgi:hypothetical protein